MYFRNTTIRFLFPLCAFAFSALPASARLPELDTIYYGQVRHKTNQPLVPLAAEQIVVIARLNGVTIATSSVAPGASAYVLKVPMDDGVANRLPGTARVGERVRIFLRSNSLDSEYETNESVVSSGLLVASTKGDVLAQNLTVTGNLDGGTVENMPMFLGSYSLGSGTGNLDSDGDGKTNAEEYAAGTDPTDSAEVFCIIDITRASGNNLIRFGPIRPNRLYTIWCTETLGASDWSNIGEVTPGNTGDYFLFGHPTPAATKLFYKLQVDAP
jgi:hypothetical protein